MHTPGPWKVVASNQTGRASAEFYIQSFYGDKRAASVAHVKHSTKRPTEANARLIAAAPDLLEALKACELLLSAAWESTLPELKQARAALAKVDAKNTDLRGSTQYDA